MEIVAKGFTKEEFTAYLKDVVKGKMGAFRPVGVTLHNTWAPKLSQWPGVVNGKTISVEQRLENIKTGYVAKGWGAGPHLFIDTQKIWAFTPLWLRGLHSPSFNGTHWGMELVGNFDVEDFPPVMFDHATHAIRELYELLGHHASPENFKFHKEDPRTTHRDCPGVNVGTKATWIAAINAPHNVPPVTDVRPAAPAKPAAKAVPKPVAAVVVNDASLQMVKKWEAFRATAYQDGARRAIGYGRNEGHRGFVITADMNVTPKQAEDWLREDLSEIATEILKNVSVKVSENQLGAMCSLAYNIGLTNFLGSSVIRKLNAGDYSGAASSFLLWNKKRVDGVLTPSKGLLRRREDEKFLFLTPDAR